LRGSVGEASAMVAPSVASAPEGTSCTGRQAGADRVAGEAQADGLIVGTVIAAIVVLAAAGVGIWLAAARRRWVGPDGGGWRLDDDHDAPRHRGQLNGDGSGVTESLDPAVAAYRTAVEDLLRELDYSHGRIPELADIINANLPDVPQPVYDELETMAESVSVTSAAVETLGAPPGYEDANGWLLDAASHMSRRILATMDGIRIAGEAGATRLRCRISPTDASSATLTWMPSGVLQHNPSRLSAWPIRASATPESRRAAGRRHRFV